MRFNIISDGSLSHDKPQPIAPPKRRKMSLNFDASSCSKMRCLGLSGFTLPKSASTSSPWTTNMKSPFLSLDPTWGKYDDVFNTEKSVEKDSTEEPNVIRDDDEYLARSLRKIAKEFEPKKCDQCNMTKV